MLTMSDTQTVWMILCRRAAGGPSPGQPFEIEEVTPAVAEALKLPEDRARKLVDLLLGELLRLPEGRRYFRREGNAVVPLPEFAQVPADENGRLDAYPYEL
jgi:hypothetical protein